MEICVCRSFYVAGLKHEVGSILSLPDQIAREVIGSGKAKEHKEAADVVTPSPKRIKKEKP